MPSTPGPISLFASRMVSSCRMKQDGLAPVPWVSAIVRRDAEKEFATRVGGIEIGVLAAAGDEGGVALQQLPPLALAPIGQMDVELSLQHIEHLVAGMAHRLCLLAG